MELLYLTYEGCHLKNSYCFQSENRRKTVGKQSDSADFRLFTDRFADFRLFFDGFLTAFRLKTVTDFQMTTLIIDNCSKISDA